jgi:hypothetical protein
MYEQVSGFIDPVSQTSSSYLCHIKRTLKGTYQSKCSDVGCILSQLELLEEKLLQSLKLLAA